MYKKYSTKLYCFSPPVMLATFLIEMGCAMYVLWRYKFNTVSRLVFTMLVLLAAFQFTEYTICAGSNMNWAKLGFVIISFLPPLGIHLATVLASKSNALLVSFAYITATIFSSFFAFSGAITQQVCGNNYIIFDIASSTSFYYGLYYYGWIMVGIFICWQWALAAKRLKTKTALWALMAGYVLLLLPTTTVNLIFPDSIAAIPSVMCGFAILLALALTLWVMPAAGVPKTTK